MTWTFFIPTEFSMHMYQSASNAVQIHPAVFTTAIAFVTGIISFLVGVLSSVNTSTKKKMDEVMAKLNGLESSFNGIKLVCDERHKNLSREMNDMKGNME